MPPRIFAPAPMSTWPPIWGAPGELVGPPVPRVTCWKMRQLGPTVALAWMTMPLGWGINRPPPSLALMGMSAPVTMLQKRCWQVAKRAMSHGAAQTDPGQLNDVLKQDAAQAQQQAQAQGHHIGGILGKILDHVESPEMRNRQ